MRWSLALPLSAAVRAALATARGLRAVDITSTVVVSRPRPLRSHRAEVMVIESLPLAGAAPAAAFLVSLTFLDAETGRVVGEASYSAASPLDSAAATPILHARSQRSVFALLHADGAARVVPGTPSVVKALEAVKVRSGLKLGCVLGFS